MGTFVTVYNGAGGRVDLEYSISQSIENNNSTVTVIAYVVKTNNTYYSYRTAPQTFTLTVNGVAVNYGWTFNFSNMVLNQRYVITSNTQVVSHSTDGTRAAISASVYCATGTEGLGTVNGSASISIPTIPRASIPTLHASSVEMGNGLTIYSNRASLTFTHILTYSFGNQSGTIAEGVADNYTWTVPIGLASAIPSATSGSGTITCYTYSGGIHIGTKSVTFIASVPASIKPIINSVTKTEAVAGIATQFGTYVQNRSQIAVNVSTSEAYSSPIVSCTTSILGTNYSGYSFTSNVLGTAGDVGITTTVTDSRGRTTSSSSIITVAAYSSPSIANFGVVRALSNGTESAESGTYLKATMNFSVASVGDKNTKSWTLEYRTTGGYWSTVSSGSTYNYNSSYTSTGSILGVDNAYEAKLTVSDWFTSTTASLPISTAFVLMDFAADGKSMAIGKVSNGNGVLDIQGDVFVGGAKINGAQKNSDITKAEIEAKLTGEIASHSHSYLPLIGGTVSGDITASSMYANNWFRSTGASGWYSQTYGGGIYCADSTYVRTYNNKKFLSDGGLMAGLGTDLELWASPAAATDPGDVVFRNNSGTELSRLYHLSDGMYYRLNGSGGGKIIWDERLAQGSVWLTNSTWASISFGKTLSGTVRVTGTGIGAVDGESYLKVRNISSTGFEATVGGTGTSNTFNWIAISF